MRFKSGHHGKVPEGGIQETILGRGAGPGRIIQIQSATCYATQKVLGPAHAMFRMCTIPMRDSSSINGRPSKL